MNEDAEPPRRKSTVKAKRGEKTPSRHDEKSPTRQNKKAPVNYHPAELFIVYDLWELRQLLRSHGQHEWLGVRIYGLLLLLDWFCRPKSFYDKAKARGALGNLCSAELANQYVSSIKRRKRMETICEPLRLLCKIGLLVKTERAVFAHVKCAARYAIAPKYLSQRRLTEVLLPPKMREKHEHAHERRDARLHRKFPYLRPLVDDLRQLTLAPEARRLIVELQRTQAGGSGLNAIIQAIDAQEHSAIVNRVGTIFTSVFRLPKRLKPLLILCGEPVAICDVSHMHHCLLPRLLADRMKYFLQRERLVDASEFEAERVRLIDRLSHGDYYVSWGSNEGNPIERQAIKKEINTLLNMPNEKCVKIGLYQKMRRAFPHTFRIVEDIKRKHHRDLSKPLQRYTSDAINAALVTLQRENIPAIPDTDAIICRESDRERVRTVLAASVFTVTGGVRCKVDGYQLPAGAPPVGCPEPF